MSRRPRLTPERFYTEMLEFANNHAAFKAGRVHGISFTARETFDFANYCANAGAEDYDGGVLDTTYEFGAARQATRRRSGPIAFFGNATVEIDEIGCPLHIAKSTYPNADDPILLAGQVTMIQRYGFTIYPEDGDYNVSMNSSLVVKDEDETYLCFADDETPGEDECERNAQYAKIVDSDDEQTPPNPLGVIQYMRDDARKRIELEPVIEDTPEAQALFWRDTIGLWQDPGAIAIQEHYFASNLRIAVATFRGLRSALERQVGMITK